MCQNETKKDMMMHTHCKRYMSGGVSRYTKGCVLRCDMIIKSDSATHETRKYIVKKRKCIPPHMIDIYIYVCIHIEIKSYAYGDLCVCAYLYVLNKQERHTHTHKM